MIEAVTALEKNKRVECTEGATYIVVGYHGMGRGGESAGLSYDTAIWDPAEQAISFEWSEPKVSEQKSITQDDQR